MKYYHFNTQGRFVNKEHSLTKLMDYYMNYTSHVSKVSIVGR